MIIHMRHTLWTGISETNVNIITSATRTHAFNNNNNAADFNYLIRWVIVTYISVVNSHATSAYECELLAVALHYLPSVRLDNAD